MDIFKDIATVIGCISTIITFVVLIFKPIRQWIVNGILHKAKESEIEKKLDMVIDHMDTMKTDASDTKLSIKLVNERVNKIENKVLDNETQRLRSEIFQCSARCRRGIPLLPEEFEFIRSVYQRYHDVLHGNHDVTTEWDYIKEYYTQNIK